MRKIGVILVVLFMVGCAKIPLTDFEYIDSEMYLEHCLESGIDVNKCGRVEEFIGKISEDFLTDKQCTELGLSEIECHRVNVILVKVLD